MATKLDKELEVLGVVIERLLELDQSARARVIVYAARRFSIRGVDQAPTPDYYGPEGLVALTHAAAKKMP
jgi:hypothetical protein